MTPQAKKQKEDWKLLLIIGGSLVAVVVTIATLARLGSDWEAKEARRATVPSPPAIEQSAPVEELVIEPVGQVVEAKPEEAQGFMVDPDADFVAVSYTHLRAHET